MTRPFDPRVSPHAGLGRPLLLVSVASALEVPAAVEGGADLVDAKDPESGALGAVTLDVLREIAGAVHGMRPVSAALGDAVTEQKIARAVRQYVEAGAQIVKVGIAGVTTQARAAALLHAAVDGARAGGGRVVAVAYADTATVLPPPAVVDIAAMAGADGVLLDTIDKAGPGLPELIAPGGLRAWVARAHDAGLWASVAGRLTAETLACAWAARADVVGVRGAACDSGRNSTVSCDRVRALRVRLDEVATRVAAARRGDRLEPPRPRSPRGPRAGSTDRPDRRPRLPAA